VGLGLAVCEAIVQAHGGNIWVEPAQRPDRPEGSAGARFVVALPRGNPPVILPESADIPAQ
jgi:two-component system sensor histidine kinase KdpD